MEAEGAGKVETAAGWADAAVEMAVKAGELAVLEEY